MKYKSICKRCGREYRYKKKKGLKYGACRKCTMYLSNRNREEEAKKKRICITCFKRKAESVKCPHCRRVIIQSPRCRKCRKDNGAWEIKRRKRKTICQ